VKAKPEEKVEAKAEDKPAEEGAAEAALAKAAPAEEVKVEVEASLEASPEAPAESAKEEAAPEQEVYYTFRWQARARTENTRQDNRGGQDRAQKPRRPKHKGKPKQGQNEPRKMSAKPPKKDKPVDPDNPFAALMALKDKS